MNILWNKHYKMITQNLLFKIMKIKKFKNNNPAKIYH